MTCLAVQTLFSKAQGSGAALVTLLVASALVVTACCGLYMVKSAMGINLFAGHVPILHALLFPIVRG